MYGYTDGSMQMGETSDDYWVRWMHKFAFGNNHEKWEAKTLIIFTALSEMDHALASPNYKEVPAGEITRQTKLFRMRESIDKELALNDYGWGSSRIPPYHVPLLDSFAVMGLYEGNPVGLAMNFYSQKIKPTRSIVFAREESDAHDLARKIFENEGVKYFPSSPTTPIERVYNQSILSPVVEGDIRFGGKRPNEVMHKFMGGVDGLNLQDASYILKIVEFPIDVARSTKENVKNIRDRIYAEIERKAA